jgi:hypothetical protein
VKKKQAAKQAVPLKNKTAGKKKLHHPDEPVIHKKARTAYIRQFQLISYQRNLTQK